MQISIETIRLMKIAWSKTNRINDIATEALNGYYENWMKDEILEAIRLLYDYTSKYNDNLDNPKTPLNNPDTNNNADTSLNAVIQKRMGQ